MQSKSKHNVLWQHDFATIPQRQEFNSCLWNVDQIFCLSDWQINQYKEVYGLDGENIDYNYDPFFKTSNGISQIEDYGIQRAKKQIVFTNRPERGMDVLLYQIMPNQHTKIQLLKRLIIKPVKQSHTNSTHQSRLSGKQHPDQNQNLLMKLI